MRREARVLGALSGSGVPHPGLIAACADENVLGAAFYLMEPIDGFNAMAGMPALHAGSAQTRREMGFAMVDGILALGRVDHVAAGLSGLSAVSAFNLARSFRKPDGMEPAPVPPAFTLSRGALAAVERRT
ncbi:phosphotransferase [Variovorax sp. J31P207]|uniref:phosphotransferase n=1 Tax=Variovorax sp. J31P207 TaxID=3053510 RepID=UPI0025785CCE|nr:phosphotransferase [Variovorax sp. J31P207]MDM0071420.1 phosphotransferase [Variovorax sp. J31P207]